MRKEKAILVLLVGVNYMNKTISELHQFITRIICQKLQHIIDELI